MAGGWSAHDTIDELNFFQDIPVLRRRFFCLGILPGAALFVAAIVRYIRTEEPTVLFASAAIAVLAGGWCWWYWRRLRNAAREILVKTRGLTCTSCGYSLVGMDENGECPECGRSYYADHLARCWSTAAGFPHA